MLHAYPHPRQSRFRCPAGLTAAAILLASLTACGRSLPPNVSPPGETASHSDPGLPQGSAAYKETAK
jgi:predicted small lipoprotein YifL